MVSASLSADGIYLKLYKVKEKDPEASLEYFRI